MYATGHLGLTLLIMSILMLPFGNNQNALYIIVLSAGLSTLPDIDMQLRQYGIKHRGKYSHSLFSAILAGVLFGLLFWYTHNSLVWVGIGFSSAFFGVVTHLIGDTFTYHSFMPLWPFSQKEVSFGFCSAGNRSVNEGLMTVGGIVFLGYFLIINGSLSGLMS